MKENFKNVNENMRLNSVNSKNNEFDGCGYVVS